MAVLVVVGKLSSQARHGGRAVRSDPEKGAVGIFTVTGGKNEGMISARQFSKADTYVAVPDVDVVVREGAEKLGKESILPAKKPHRSIGGEFVVGTVTLDSYLSRPGSGEVGGEFAIHVHNFGVGRRREKNNGIGGAECARQGRRELPGVELSENVELRIGVNPRRPGGKSDFEGGPRAFDGNDLNESFLRPLDSDGEGDVQGEGGFPAGELNDGAPEKMDVLPFGALDIFEVQGGGAGPFNPLAEEVLEASSR